MIEVFITFSRTHENIWGYAVNMYSLPMKRIKISVTLKLIFTHIYLQTSHSGFRT